MATEHDYPAGGLLLSERQETAFFAVPSPSHCSKVDKAALSELMGMGLVCKQPDGTLQLSALGRRLYIDLVAAREP